MCTALTRGHVTAGGQQRECAPPALRARECARAEPHATSTPGLSTHRKHEPKTKAKKAGETLQTSRRIDFSPRALRCACAEDSYCRVLFSPNIAGRKIAPERRKETRSAN
eukprot:scaffold67092_cov61-Phaeocystis_antarctica.AAC.2